MDHVAAAKAAWPWNKESQKHGASADHLDKREISVFLEPSPSALGLVATR